MTTKTKIIIALVLVSIIVGISLFFYYRGKKKAAAAADAAAKSKLTEVPLPPRTVLVGTPVVNTAVAAQNTAVAETAILD